MQHIIQLWVEESVLRILPNPFLEYPIQICFSWNTSDISVFGVEERGGVLDGLEKKFYGSGF
jgi:hypothetical protein